MDFQFTIDKDFKRVNIYLNDQKEYVLRCFKDGIVYKNWNYHTGNKEEAFHEALIFLNSPAV